MKRYPSKTSIFDVTLYIAPIPYAMSYGVNDIKVTQINAWDSTYSRYFMFYIHYCFLFTYTSVQHDFHIRGWSCHSTVIRRVLVGTGVHITTLPIPRRFLVDSRCSIFDFLCGILWFIVCLVVLVLSVLWLPLLYLQTFLPCFR
jgi:hypothetical protein